MNIWCKSDPFSAWGFKFLILIFHYPGSCFPSPPLFTGGCLITILRPPLLLSTSRIGIKKRPLYIQYIYIYVYTYIYIYTHIHSACDIHYVISTYVPSEKKNNILRWPLPCRSRGRRRQTGIFIFIIIIKIIVSIDKPFSLSIYIYIYTCVYIYIYIYMCVS